MDFETRQIADLHGLTLSKIEVRDNYRILFHAACGRVFEMCHNQSCCEEVTIRDVVGDWKDLLGTPILRAEERSGFTPIPDDDDDLNWEDLLTRWTALEQGFYELATVRGSLTITWGGQSDSDYSLGVDFAEIESEFTE